MMKTYSQKQGEIEKSWHLVDAKGLVLGRMAAIIASILKGKHKPTFTPHMDGGDHVIVINADHVHLTGAKMENKIYYRHTGYPGGIRSTTPKERIGNGQSDRIITDAVRRMLGRGPLGRARLRHLRVYPGDQHPHQSVSPTPLDIGALNSKNRQR